MPGLRQPQHGHAHSYRRGILTPESETLLALVGAVVLLVTAPAWITLVIRYCWQGRAKAVRAATRRTAEISGQVNVWAVVAVILVISWLRAALDDLQWWEWGIVSLFVVLPFTAWYLNRRASRRPRNQSEGGWRPDPTQRHELRWQTESGEWSDRVFSGILGTDPYSPPPDDARAAKRRKRRSNRPWRRRRGLGSG